MTEHNALIWADGVTAMARGSELRMNASDVKKGNPYHVPPTVGATMTDELADRLDSLADETTRAADALLMREAAATIRAERVAPDRETFVDFAEDWYDRNAGPGEGWALNDLYDALLASGVLGVNADTIRAEAVENAAHLVIMPGFNALRARAAEYRGAASS